MPDKYILRPDDPKTPVPCDDLFAWGRFMQDGSRHVAKTTVGEAEVSTVFLGLDHNWGEGPPLLWETLIFGGDHDQEMWRYSTWENAKAGHEAAVAMLRASAH